MDWLQLVQGGQQVAEGLAPWAVAVWAVWQWLGGRPQRRADTISTLSETVGQLSSDHLELRRELDQLRQQRQHDTGLIARLMRGIDVLIGQLESAGIAPLWRPENDTQPDDPVERRRGMWWSRSQ